MAVLQDLISQRRAQRYKYQDKEGRLGLYLPLCIQHCGFRDPRKGYAYRCRF